MKPEPNDTTIKLPVTFDYQGGRSDNKRGNIIISLVLFAIAILLTIFMVRGNGTIVSKVLIIAGVWLLIIFFVRFKLLREQVYSDAYETLKEIDNIPSTDSFWNIYEIDDEYPYICHFRDGKSGIFVRLEKDVVVGKEDNVMFNHFDAISEAYNIAGSSDINMCQIDYMDNVGNDPRLNFLYDSLNNCDNPDMRDALLSMYSNLQEEMSHNYASFDVYLFTCRNKEDQLWYNVKKIVDMMLCGNYLTFRALDIEGIRTTCMAVFNLTEFSAIEACENIVSNKKFKGIVPISVEHYDGSVDILNKTQSQLRQEAQERARKAEEQKRNKKSSRVNTDKSGVSKAVNIKTDEVTTNTQSDNIQSNNTQVDMGIGGINTSANNNVSEDDDLNFF